MKEANEAITVTTHHTNIDEHICCGNRFDNIPPAERRFFLCANGFITIQTGRSESMFHFRNVLEIALKCLYLNPLAVSAIAIDHWIRWSLKPDLIFQYIVFTTGFTTAAHRQGFRSKKDFTFLFPLYPSKSEITHEQGYSTVMPWSLSSPRMWRYV